LRYTTVLLSQVVHQTNKKGLLRERLRNIAFNLTERYAGQELQCDPQTVSTFKLLRDLVTFFDDYHEKKYQSALEILAETKLVPSNMSELETCVHNFKRFSQPVFYNC